MLEFYVIECDFNTEKPIRKNILNENLIKDIKKKYKNGKIKDKTDLKKYLKAEFMHDYWCRAEHEYMLGDLFEEDPKKYTKLDVYFQIEKNIDMISDYIIYRLFKK